MTLFLFPILYDLAEMQSFFVNLFSNGCTSWTICSIVLASAAQTEFAIIVVLKAKANDAFYRVTGVSRR